jgi:LacI family transcriptional regulator, galactose operon repressor
VVTLYDVARQAGVSIATVSRVLHGQESVRETTSARVRAAIEELGYVPDGAAQSLARNRKDVIGLVCVEHTGLNPNQYDIESMSLLFYDEVMRGAEALIRDRHWSLLITYLREDELLAGYSQDELDGGALLAEREEEPVLPRLLTLSGKVDGLLIGEGVVPTTALARLARRLPVVVVAGDPALRGVDVVAADNWSGAYALVSHLVVEHGRRRLFHVDGPETAPDAKTRRMATQAVIDGQPGVKLVGACSGRFSVRSGEAAAEQMLADFGGPGGDLPDAIICANDQMAIGVLRTLTKHSIRVPDDIALIGFDDIYPATLCDPPLTTVNQPIRSIGERACERLIERIAHPTLRTAVELLPTELVIRTSCGCPPGTVVRKPVETVAPAPSPCPPKQQTPVARHPPARHQAQEMINDPIKER